MTAIWRKDGSTWKVLSPAGFPDENDLHGLVEDAPELLPLSGRPRLAIIGRNVRLGPGYADLLAVESTGRLAVVEVKLARNDESRRAIIAQVLAYASYLRGMTREAVEADLVGAYLRDQGFDGLDAAVRAEIQDGSFDPIVFDAGLRECLKDGRFRLVLVLDSAPSELVHLVGYLEALGSLVIDLMTVSAYSVGEDRLLIPQRVDPERVEAEVRPPAGRSKLTGEMTKGGAGFADFVEGLPEAKRQGAQRLLDWASRLESDALAHLVSYVASTFATLLPYVVGEDVGLVTIGSEGVVLPWKSVFLRRAPNSMGAVEAAIAPVPLGNGKHVKNINPDVIAALTAAYREAAGQRR